MKKIMIALFALFLAVPGIWILAEGITGTAPTYSEAEQRNLEPFPEFSVDGLDEYGEQVESYINDHTPFRDSQVAFKSALDYYLFGIADTATEASMVTLGEDGWVFYAGQNSVNDYRGISSWPDEFYQSVANLMNALNAKLEEKGIEFVVLFAPNKERVYREYMPDYLTIVNEKNRLDILVDHLRAATNIPIVYPKECFEDGRYQWYYKTDTHWNQAGGFLAGQELIKALGGDAAGIDQVEVTYGSRGTGDLVRLAHLPQEAFEETEAFVNGYLPDTNLNMAEDTSYYPTLKYYTSDNAPDPRHVVLYRDSFSDSIAATMARYFDRVDLYWWNSGAEERMGQETPDVVVYEILERYIDERIIDDLNKLITAWD